MKMGSSRGPPAAPAPPPAAAASIFHFLFRRRCRPERQRPHGQSGSGLGTLEYLKGVLVALLQIGRNVPELLPIRRDNFDVAQRLGRIELRKRGGRRG